MHGRLLHPDLMLARARTLATRSASLRHSRLYSAQARDDSRWPGWDVVVGIEVHAQIKSRVKLFSGQLRSRHCPWGLSLTCTVLQMLGHLTITYQRIHQCLRSMLPSLGHYLYLRVSPSMECMR